ncbi:MAG: folylpolyglutamate synthase/dihydrofolate synthase family protein [Candidatus Norongarragalinales archaeon]
MPRFNKLEFDYEKFSAAFPKKKRWTLRSTRALLHALKFKQKFRVIHIAGTNGKGSVAAFLDCILQASGVKTGLYVSPHLVRFNERIQTNGRKITNKELTASWSKAKPVVESWNKKAKHKEKISEFEASTALAFKFFENKKCEYAVIECGLGGRLDATNVVKPTVTIITRIDLDHTAELGSTTKQITREKAAIIKRGATACVALDSGDAAALAVVRARAKKEKIPLFVVGASTCADVKISKVKATLQGTSFTVGGSLGKARLRARLLGMHQAENAALAWSAAKILQQTDSRITDKAIREGIESAKWPGRLEIISKKPLVVFDGAHNPNAAEALAKALRALWPQRKWVLVFAAMRDKDYEGVLRAVAPIARAVVATQVTGNERSAKPREIARAARRFCKKVWVEENAANALKKAETLAGLRDAVLACGSLYLIGELERRKVF